jgi:hypothetical protein
MIIDLEIITLVCLILILIYNYYINDCYRYFKHDKYKQQQKYHKMFKSIDDTYRYPKYPRYYTSNNLMSCDNFTNNSNTKYPNIELEEFANSVNTDTKNLPDNILLNDRYNDYITSYTDDQLTNIILNKPSDTNDNEYTQSLVNDLQKNIIFDMDKKLSDKSKKTQKLAKDSATIASRFGRNSLIESYRNELDEYEKERTPWWAEAEYN